MKIRRILILVGVIVIAALLAFRLSGTVYAMIVLPISYLLWLLKLLYFAMPGIVWWSLVILAVLYILLMSLIQDIKIKKGTKLAVGHSKGSVENLAVWITKSSKGIYFKWLLANRLGRIAYQILENRFSGRKRSLFDPLTGPGWDADTATQAYLESGLQGSFANYSRNKYFFSKPIQTPLDHDVDDVIAYLETQMGE